MRLMEQERCEEMAAYMIEHRATVRSTARYFSLSKSTVHKDLTVRLRSVNPGLWASVCKILAVNKSERHLRGGEATRRKYMEHPVQNRACASTGNGMIRSGERRETGDDDRKPEPVHLLKK